MALETQAIKFINNDEMKILNKKENLFKESLDDYNKEKERLDQDSLLGNKKVIFFYLCLIGCSTFHM
jgi:hypothetical protein